MKKFKNVLVSKESVRGLTNSGADPKLIKILEHMVSNNSSLSFSLAENGVVGMAALEMAENMVDLGLINESVIDDFKLENEAIDKAMGEAIASGGEGDFVDESEIWAILSE